MNSELIEKALPLAPSTQALINAVSKRVKQFNNGGDRPLVNASFRAGLADIALQEIIEGKLLIEPAPAESDSASTTL